MMEPLPDLPDDVIGFRAVGKIEAADYRDVLIPAVERAAAAGSIRLVFVFEKFDGFSGGAAWQDMRLGFDHLKAWKRTALVTDVDWIAKALHMFAWLTPGEVRLYELGGLEDAKAWVAAGGEDPA